MSNLLLLLMCLNPGEMYLFQHDFNSACRYYKLMMTLDPSPGTMYGAALCALVENRPERSIQLFELLDHKDPFILYCLGIACYRIDDYERATRYFKQVPDTSESGDNASYYLGLLMLKRHNIEEAMEYFRRIPDSNDKELLVTLIGDYSRLYDARDIYDKQDYDGAVGIYRSVTHFPDYRTIGLALSYSQQAMYEQSLVYCDSVIVSSSDTTLVLQAFSIAAAVSMATKHFSEARYYLKKYLEITQTDQIIYLLGRTYSDEARYDSAQALFMALPDTIDEYLFFKGRTEYFLGNWGRAEEYLLRHREFFSGSSYGDRSIFILASINFKRNEHIQAISFYADLVHLYPNSTYASLSQKGIGDAYVKVGDYKNALDAYQRVVEFKPSPILEAQTTLCIYETYFLLGRYGSWLEALRRYVEEHPLSPLVKTTCLRIAQILYDNKDYYQSLAEVNRIIEEYPHSAVAHKALIQKARIYKNLGAAGEVKRAYHELLFDEDACEYHSYAADELALQYADEAKYDSALHYYNMLLDDTQYQEKAVYEIARTYQLLGQDGEAEMMIDKLVNDFPLSVFLFDALMMKTQIYKNQGKYNEALAALQELLKKVGAKPEIYVEMGNVYYRLEDYLNARFNYLLACEHFKQRRDEAAKALMLAGDASSLLGDRKSAREHYLRASLIAMSPLLKNQATSKLSVVAEE